MTFTEAELKEKKVTIPTFEKVKIFDSEDIDFFAERSKQITNQFCSDYENLFRNRSISNHLTEISLISRLLSIRFINNEVLDLLNAKCSSYAAKFLEIKKQDLFLCPLFTLRQFRPNESISKGHQEAFLQTEPHYDNGFGHFGMSVWIPFHQTSIDTGSLCKFTGPIIEKKYSLKEGRNVLNHHRYYSNYKEHDSILKKAITVYNLNKGDALFHSNVLHGATKAKNASRESFNFRYVSRQNVSSLKNYNFKEIHQILRDNVALFRASHLNFLGDYKGAKRILDKNPSLNLNKNSLNPPYTIEERIGMKLHWSDEYKWIT